MRRDYLVLVIDDDTSRCEDLTVVLEYLGEPVISCSSHEWTHQVKEPERLLAAIVAPSQIFDLPKLLSQLHSSRPSLPILILSDKLSPSLFEPSVNESIIGFVQVPLNLPKLIYNLQYCQIFQEQHTQVDNRGNNRPLLLFRSLTGTSNAIRETRMQLEQAAHEIGSVMLVGEPHVGKEVAARHVHYYSSRRDKPFIVLNCRIYREERLLQELFGNLNDENKAVSQLKTGRWDLAAGGTLFLEAVESLPSNIQAKLAQVLYEQTISVNPENQVRVIVGCSSELINSVEKGDFNKDLYQRLSESIIKIPSLRDRSEDIPLLIDEIMARNIFSKSFALRLTPAAINLLSHYSWPGNIREMANVIERLMLLKNKKVIDINNLPAKITQPGKQLDLAILKIAHEIPVTVTQIMMDMTEDGSISLASEADIIRKALANCNDDPVFTSEYLHMRRNALLDKINKYGLAYNLKSSEKEVM